MSFETLFNDKEILNYLNKRTQKPLVGESLFPEKKIQALEAEYIKGANNLPVSASVHAFDTEAQIASRDGAGKVALELALIKRKIRVDEKKLIQLNTPRNDAEYKQAQLDIFNDVEKMVNAVRTRVEAMRMEALTSGQIAISENGVTKTLDYGVPAGHKEALSGTTLWTADTATPLDDIYRWVDKVVSDTGYMPTRALTSKAVLNALLRHASIRKALYGVNSDRVLTKADLNAFLAQMDLPSIATYDEQYRVQNANGTYTSKRFFDESKIVLFGPEKLGDTLYGSTAEEIELSSKSDVDISAYGNIIAQVYSTNDPVAKWTKAVATALPSFPSAEEVFIATVK